MSSNTDIRQSIILALEATGTDALSTVRDAMKSVQGAMSDLETQQANGLGAREFLKAIMPLAAELGKLQSIERDIIATQDSMEKDTYELAHAYEVLEHAMEGVDKVRSRQNQAAGNWVNKQEANLGSLIGAMNQVEQTSDALTALELRNYQAVAAASGRQVAAIGRQGDAIQRAGQGASRAVLGLSRGIEDLTTGGFLGILNNIPEFVNGIGTAAGVAGPQLAMLTGGVSLLATASFLVYTHWDKIEQFFEAGIPRPILDGTDELKRKLADATKVTNELGKESRLSIDQLHAYEKATGDIKKFNAELERRRDLEALLKGKSKAESERASAFKEAVAESGGVMALDSLDTAINQTADGKGDVFNEIKGKSTKSREFAEDLMREAAEGDKRARDSIQGFLRGAYSHSRFADNIRKLSPERKAEDDARELRNDEEERELKQLHDKGVKDRADAKKDADDLAKRVADAKKAVGPGVDEDLESSIFHSLQAGNPAAVAGGDRKAGLLDTLGKRGVPDDIIDRVADELLWQAVDKAENLIEKNKKPSLDVKAEAAMAKLARAGQSALKKGQADQDRAAAKVDDGILPQLEAQFAQNRINQIQQGPRGSMKEEDLKRSLEAQVGRFLAQNSMDPGMADEIVRNAFEKMSQQYIKNQAMNNNAVMSLAQILNQSQADLARQGQQQRDLLQRAMNAMRGGNQRPPFRPNGMRLN